MLTFGVTLVRHGETQYNKDKLLQGQGVDTPLSETGMQQAEAAGLYLKNLKFTNVFVSDMLRARQTANIIMRSNLPSAGTEIVIDPMLKERSFGIAEGRPVQDMKTMAKAAGVSCPQFTPPGGETLEQVKLRVKGFLQNMFQRMFTEHSNENQAPSTPPPLKTDEPITGLPDDGIRDLCPHALVVSHGAFMLATVRYLVGDLQASVPQDVKMSHMFSVCSNTGICRFVISVKKDGSEVEPSSIRCIFINRKEHLKPDQERE